MRFLESIKYFVNLDFGLTPDKFLFLFYEVTLLRFYAFLKKKCAALLFVYLEIFLNEIECTSIFVSMDVFKYGLWAPPS